MRDFRKKMRIGIIGPSKLEYLEEVNKKAREILKKISARIAKQNYDIVLCPDKGSVSEFFALNYIENKGKKVYEIVPLDDKEFGYGWVNLDLGEHINCKTWRNQPEKLNEETDVLLCLGYAVGVLAEIAYTKWFKKKPVYIVRQLVSGKQPKEIRGLDLRYISVSELEKKLKTGNL